MNALRRIHAALITGGLLIDTQPVSSHPPVDTSAGQVGSLDLREWGKIIREKNLSSAERDHYFRSLDFITGPEKDAALLELLTAK